MLRDLTNIKGSVIKAEGLDDFKLSPLLKSKLKGLLNSRGYDFNDYTSYAVTDKETEEKPANFALIPNQYFVFSCQVYELAIELYKYFDIYDRLRPHAKKMVGDENYIIENIKADPLIQKEFENDEDVTLFAKFLDKSNSKYRLGSKRLINDLGAPRGSKDCFGSVILKEINLPDASSSIFGRLVYDLCANSSVYEELIHANEDTNSEKNSIEVETVLSNSMIRGFVYDVFMYLFEQGVEDNLFKLLRKIDGKEGRIYSELVLEERKIYRLFRVTNSELEGQELISGTDIRYFPHPFKIKNEYCYLTNQWADNSGDSKNSRDIMSLATIFNEMFDNLKIIKENDIYKLLSTTNSSYSAVCLPKPFLLLAGISGTGKTRFVREQARATDPTLKNYCLVPVRPDWHEPSDLLGYISRLSGHAEYVTTDVLTFIVKAWQAVAPNADKAGMGDINAQSIPYWLCLDEMNLAPVEQYFADYLSVLESREFSENGYQCEALLNANMLQRLIETDTHLPNNLGLSSSDDLWKYFLEHGISLPPNLIVAGTVNMDETTHGFSRKVIDRAITLDFGEFFPNVYADFFDQKIEPIVFTWSPLTHCLIEDLASTEDVDGTKSIAFLEEVNAVLKRTPFELAYRALNELLLQVACLKPKNESELQAIWDDFLMTKVLPRIDGDEDKLRLLTDGGDGTLLDGLMTVLEESLPLIWNDGRKDFFRLNIGGTNTSDIICRSKAKLAWMKDRLAINTFTSYWP